MLPQLLTPEGLIVLSIVILVITSLLVYFFELSEFELSLTPKLKFTRRIRSRKDGSLSQQSTLRQGEEHGSSGGTDTGGEGAIHTRSQSGGINSINSTIRTGEMAGRDHNEYYAPVTNIIQPLTSQSTASSSFGAHADAPADKATGKTVSKRRRIDAAAPSEGMVGQYIDLLLQVRFPNSPLLGLKDWPTKVLPASLEQKNTRVR